MRRLSAGSGLRTSAMVMFGFATIAALIGLVFAVNRTQPPPAAAPAAITSAPASPPRPSVIPFPPPAISNPAEVPSVTQPSAPPETSAAAPADEKRANRGEVRVLNNSTIRGLAARAARDLGAADWTVVEVGNFSHGSIPTTTVYYQDGTDQRAIAEAIATKFGMRLEPRSSGVSSAGPGVIVIVTNDYSYGGPP